MVGACYRVSHMKNMHDGYNNSAFGYCSDDTGRRTLASEIYVVKSPASPGICENTRVSAVPASLS